MPNDPSLPALAGVLLIALMAGGINSIAAGGTLLTYPVLVALGVPPHVANATCGVAFLPSAFSSMWGYRDELRGAGGWLLRITLPSVAGGVIGAFLFLNTPPEEFARIVPFLVLSATCLFMAQNWIMHRAGIWRDPVEEEVQHDAPEPRLHDPPLPRVRFLLAQLAMGIYGGYFGAGIGIVILAVLGLVGFSNIHRMNGLKNWATACMNVLASGMFILSGIVNWPVALTMAMGGLVGGYGASRLALRSGQQLVRRAVVAVGLGSFVFLLLRPL